ncbi:hypothetical protein [Sulfitobacter sp. PM12]|uniref:hypothetical protein n=1 Tax=Sulfitobacter sp. PM12 TaxID=3138497 RepID=UPI00388F4105
MNLKQTRIAIGGAKNAVGHIHKTDENESVRVLEGDVNDILVGAELDARALGRSKSVRHIVISPDQELTDDQRNEAIQMIRDEFAMGDRPIYLVEHVKARADGTKIPHFHGLVPETYGSGAQIDHAHFKRRNEKLARKMELAFGHNLTKGKHNKSVYNALNADGDKATAAAIKHLTEEKPALAKYGDKSHQKAKRAGYNLPSISEALTALQGAAPADIAAGLNELCEAHGVTVQKSDRRAAILIVGEDGTVLKNANRSLKIKAAQVDSILENVGKDNENDRPTHAGRDAEIDGGELSRAARARDLRASELGAVYGLERSGESGRLVRLDVDDASNESRHIPDYRAGDTKRVERRSVDAVDQGDDRDFNEIRAEDRRDVVESAVLVRPESDRDYRHGRDRGVRDALEQSPKRVVERADEDVYRRIQRQHHHAEYDDFTDQLRVHNASKAVESSISDGVYHAIQRQHHRNDYDGLTDQLRAHNAARADKTSTPDADVYHKIQRQHHRADYDDLTDKMQAHNASKTAQPREPQVTIQHRLARSWVAQKVQPLLDKLRAHSVARRGRSALDIRRRENISENLKDQIEALKLQNSTNKKLEESRPNDTIITRNKDAASVGRRATKAESRDPGSARSRQTSIRREANAGAVGRANIGEGSGPRVTVEGGAESKQDHRVLRAVRDRVDGRAMGRVAKALEPMRKSFAENSGMYNTASDLQLMPDTDDPLYAEKVLTAWSRSMQGPGGP